MSGDPAKVFYSDPSSDGQLVRTLTAVSVHGADLGEAMATARRVRKPTGQSWYDEWSRTAAVARTDAETALAAGDRVSARNAFLRASEYFRQAFYFIRSDLSDPRMQDAYQHHVETFSAAIKLLDHPAIGVHIPYQGTTLAGYLFSADASGTARPTVLAPCGYDSTAEAGWYMVPPAIDRGYNVLLFEGPGQGEALYKQRLYFRPDFETVLTPVLNWLLVRPEVDPHRIALIGRSFAGYLAPRAAAFEHRIAALVCDPAQPDMGARLPKGLVGRIAAPVVRAQTRINTNRAEFFGARMAAHGLKSIEDYFAELRRFTMLADAGLIRCPTLIIEAENDFAGGSGKALRDAMTAPVDLINLTAVQGADGHCGGLGQELWAGVAYGWLATALNPAPAVNPAAAAGTGTPAPNTDEPASGAAG